MATMLLDSLRELRRKVKLLGVFFGAGIVVAAAVCLLLFTVLVDYLLNLPAVPRLILILAALAAVIYAAARWIVRPAFTPLSLSDLAGRLENAFPQFDDRLRSTVDFASGQEIPGSAEMKRRVVSEATEMAEAVDLSSAVETRRVWSSAGVGGAAVLLALLVCMLMGSHLLGIAASRLFTPFSARAWPKSVEIGQVAGVPQRVPVGQRIDLTMQLSKGHSRKAVILYRYDNGPWQSELMTPGEHNSYTASLDARIDPNRADGSLQIKLQAGDDEKVLSPVAVVPRLDVSHIEARITSPPYAGHELTTVALNERPAVLVAGAEVDVVVDFNKGLDPKQPIALALTRAEPKADAAKPQAAPEGPQVAWERASDTRAVAHFRAADSFRFTVDATDIDGFKNTNGQEYELIVREDALPTVQIEEPRRSEDRTPNAEFDVKATAEDDYGIAQAQLVVERVGDKTPSINNKWVVDLVKDGATPAPGVSWARAEEKSERQRFRLEYHWQLESLGANLKPGDVLEYFIQVKDNFALNGREHPFVPSGKLRLTIISHEQWAAAVQQRIEQIYNELKQVQLSQLRTKQDTDNLAKGTQERGKFDEADKTAAERLANQQGTTASQTVQTAQKLDELVKRMQENKSAEGGVKQASQEVSKQLTHTADGPMKEAGKGLGEAKDHPADPKAAPDEQKKDAAARAENLAQASQKQQEAADQLAGAMSKLGNFSTLSERIEMWRKMQKDQEDLRKQFTDSAKNALGKKPEELSKEQREAAEKLSKQQEDMQKKAEAALSDMQKKAEQSEKTDPATAQAMKQAAQAGRNVPGQQQQSAAAMKQNQQAQAQAAQKQIDIGIEMILQKLKEAERRKLEELAKQLDDAQKLIAELLRRQAGHNIGNLMLQDPKKLANLDSAERDDLLAKAQFEAEKLPAAPTQQQLSASQEQTERNCRDVAKTAEALPDPAPASKLTDAAGHMERAIVHLRNGKLPDAYDPPQVQALQELADAAQAVQKALDEVNKKLEEQDQESIKAAYVKVLEKQKKLDEETAKIDGVAKDPAGNLPRETSVRLGQLPGVQGELSKTTADLGDKLVTLKSIVYVWANKDIVTSMDQVKDDLAKPLTGKPTQAEQTRIEEQLQAMINSLVQTKSDKRFAERNGGGGGQCKGCKAVMPSEAELRLLKELQQAINKSTAVINGEKEKDNNKLLALGGRQGDIRSLLDRLLQEASGGEVKLSGEPDNKDQLPEEAKAEDIEDQELQKELVDDTPTDDAVNKGVKLTGDRMARSRQRLALNNDPGQTTQEIQKRIVIDLDQLIQLAQQQQQQMASKPGSKPGQKPGPPKPGQQPGPQQVAVKPGTKPGQPKTGGLTPAQVSAMSNGSDPQEDLNREIRQRAAEWGGLSKRDREAVIEGSSDTAIKKYEKLVDDYYLTLAKKATER